MEIKTKWLKNQPKTNGRKSHRNSFGLPGIYGDSRHVRYVAFLWENYFPTHDEFCEVEGKLMREFLGDGIASQPAGDALEKLSGRTATYREACFA